MWEGFGGARKGSRKGSGINEKRKKGGSASVFLYTAILTFLVDIWRLEEFELSPTFNFAFS